MYLMGSDTYVCDFCETEFPWKNKDEQYGETWECENPECGKHFCTHCFTKRHGAKAFSNMLQAYDAVLCPDCYEVEKTLIQKK